MASRYGPLWTNTHGEAPGQIDQGEWGEVVAKLSEDQLRAGFTADLERGSDYPPSSAKFAAMCKPAPTYHRRYPVQTRIEDQAKAARCKQRIEDIAKQFGFAL